MLSHVVYGPPGCGKTTEMLRRVAEARTRGFGVADIAYLSFTRAAANEALKRLGVSSSPKVCTIHALCFRLLEISSMQIVDWPKLRRFGQQVGVPIKGQVAQDAEIQALEIGDQFLSLLALARNSLLPVHEVYFAAHERPASFETFEYFVESYQSWKEVNGYVDFTDMLEQFIKAPVQHGAKVLFVDEAQDLSKLQWRVLRTLWEQDTIMEMHIAGDDDQAIYEWAGADTHGMAAFEEEHNARRQVLSQSWRVPALPHQLATEISKRIQRRVTKEYLPRADAAGSVTRHFEFTPRMVKHGRDTLVLCRTAVAKSKIERELIEARVPYLNGNGKPGMYQSQLADAIRAFRKLERGELLSRPEGDKLMRQANDRTRAELEREEFKPMLARGIERSLKIPSAQVEFYRHADLDSKATIRLSTIHSAKGQEAEHVVVDTSITERTETEMLVNPDAEARVWYVAVTRTKDRLDIIESTGERSYDL